MYINSLNVMVQAILTTKKSLQNDGMDSFYMRWKTKQEILVIRQVDSGPDGCSP